MKDLKLPAAIARKVWAAASKDGKTLLEEVAGKEYFAVRPQGVWILTSDGKAVRPEDWDRYLAATDSTGDGEAPGLPIGVGLVTEAAAVRVYTGPSVVLQFGSPKVEEYPEICFDDQTLASEAATSAIIDAHKGAFCKYGDSGIFDFADAPAAGWCRSLGGEWSLPTLATLKLIQSHAKETNAAIRTIGGYILTPGFYWTSTVKKTGYAFVVIMGDFVVDCNDKDDNIYVRAVSAFQIEDFDFLTF